MRLIRVRRFFFPLSAFFLFSCFVFLVSRSARAQDYVLHEHPAIQYATRATRDPVAKLNAALASGSVTLRYEEKSGYLRSVLDALKISPESQLLIFSKTGIQGAVTGPRHPRALYFNDSVVVGFIAGARLLEVAAHDPEQGVIFYTLDQSAPVKTAFDRPRQCLSCHVSSHTSDVPGMLVRSIFTAGDGAAVPQLGFNVVNHTTPVPHRWGGWFVTGDYRRHPYAGLSHMGNATVPMHANAAPLVSSNEIFIEWMNSGPETRGYPSAESDIAALMVFDHQMHAINLLTRVNWEVRAGNSGTEQVEQLVDYLLFVDAAAPPARIIPRRGFAAAFTGIGPRDRQGRSLRDLDLDRRLMRYPLSYMVYSEAFDNLPGPAKQVIYERLWAVLSGRDSRPKYEHLSAEDRTAIVEILRDTKTDLPDIFSRR